MYTVAISAVLHPQIMHEVVVLDKCAFVPDMSIVFVMPSELIFFMFSKPSFI